MSFKTGKKSVACEMISRQGIIKRYPEDDRFFARLGDAYYKKGDLQNSLQTYSDLLKLNPNDQNVKNKIQEISKELYN